MEDLAVFDESFVAVWAEESRLALTHAVLADSVTGALVGASFDFAAVSGPTFVAVAGAVHAFSVSSAVVFACFSITISSSPTRITFYNSFFDDSMYNIPCTTVSPLEPFITSAFTIKALSMTRARIYTSLDFTI